MSEQGELKPQVTGPLAGLRIVEFNGIGPVPFAGMLLADMGADVVRIRRPDSAPSAPLIMDRGRREVRLDLKDPNGHAEALALLDEADALIEGFRPGVMERLGLPPELVHLRNPRLVYGRMTGYGQAGPLAAAAGHDINYIGLSGALEAIGDPETPRPPLNLVGDYGGGALYLVTGLLAALFSARTTGRGQVIDCAMCDGAASLMTLFCDWRADGRWQEGRGRNLLDGGSPVYAAYRCADGRFLAVGAIEPHFWRRFCEAIGVPGELADLREERSAWPALRQAISDIIGTKPRDEWAKILEATDACATPVLSLAEAPHHRQLAARGTYVQASDGRYQPAPSPRFSMTPSQIRPVEHSTPRAIIAEWRREA